MLNIENEALSLHGDGTGLLDLSEISKKSLEIPCVA